MKRRNMLLLALGVAAGALAAALLSLLPVKTTGTANASPVGRAPHIRPDYADAIIPPNIAPLNFQVQEEGTEYAVEVRGENGQAFQVAGGTPRIEMPARRWRQLLGSNTGGHVYFDICARAGDGSWRRFAPVSVSVAPEPIDRYVVYRRINVLYQPYVKMGLYQRDLESFAESCIIDNKSFDYGCVNCHTFFNNHSDRVIIHVRSGRVDYGAGMLLLEGGRVRKIDARTEFTPRPAGFISWHPSGKLAAFSINAVRQSFHSARVEVRDGVDLDSAIAIYIFASGAVASTPALSNPHRLETFPAWSADGRYLYFCSAPVLWTDRNKVPPEHFEQVRYSLMRIPYDIEKNSWGQLDTVLSADKVGKSITLPRASPDGRFLVFCMSDYSTFPTFQPSADLYLMDLATGRYERMDCNSEWSESWHSWSSNSRWLAFSSKRGDGLFSRSYFSYIDRQGKAHKPFVLPQQDPAFYDSWIKLYQMPELTLDPVPITGEALARAIRSGPWERSSLPMTSVSPRVQTQKPPAPPAPAPAPEPWTAPP